MYERDGGISLDRVFYLVNVHGPFVEEVVEDIVSLESFFSILFVAKDEVYPLMEVGGDIVTLQSLYGDELARNVKNIKIGYHYIHLFIIYFSKAV